MRHIFMKYQTTLRMLAAALLLGTGTMANAAPDNEATSRTEDEQLRARLEAEYEKAMSAAEQQQLTAEASMNKAREQLELAAEQRASAERQSAEAQSAQEAEMAKMYEELNNARRQLQETSREIARVNREVARARVDRHASSLVVRTSERPVIGVILGDADDKGVEILGVSPDGPSERAGIKKGDVIVALDGRKLSAIEDSDNPREGLRIALRDIKADQPLVIAVNREGQTLDLTVVPEVREPLTWQTITRFPTAPTAPATPAAPGAPEKVITIEHIVVPEIDTAAMSAQIEQMRSEIEKRRAVREASRLAPVDGAWGIEFDEMSELGHLALQDTEIWFGLPMAQGLQLAEIDPGLGEYFKTDRGVLVLKARADNGLQLKSGDVILQVGDTEVNTPAEFMRALRGFDSGDELVMDIKRNRKDHTLKTVMPEARSSYFFPEEGKTHTFTITSTTD
jgi:C-terminal processing protease CtpA/Prc